MHLDGAFGLWAAASPALAHLVAGAADCDSWATDAHKYLNVPYDCGIVAVAHPEAHRTAMTWDAAYIPRDDAGDPFAHVPEASRRARAFPVWAAVQQLGRHGIAAMVEGCALQARALAERLAAEPGVRILNDVVLNQALVRFEGDDTEEGDDLTRRVVARLQADGVAWFGATVWQGTAAMRISVSNHRTGPADIERTAEAILSALRRERSASPSPRAG